jgi:chemotaxis protein CheX
MDVNFINPFLQGTIEVLTKMAFVDPRPGKVYLKETSLAQGDVSGIIGITGDMIGSLAISFSESCICHLISRMLGESLTEATQEVFDGVGELTNMVSGVARTYLEKDGMEVYAAIPSIVYGKDHTINHILKSPSIVIPFETDKGTFVVDVCIRKANEGPRISENYQVLNQKTSLSSAEPARQNNQSGGIIAPTGMDRKTMLKNKLRDINIIRDDIVRQLSEKPFMAISQRQLLKRRIPLLDAQIKRLRLDISTIEMLSNISKDDLENPKLVQHYQHYDTNKKKS